MREFIVTFICIGSLLTFCGFTIKESVQKAVTQDASCESCNCDVKTKDLEKAVESYFSAWWSSDIIAEYLSREWNQSYADERFKWRSIRKDDVVDEVDGYLKIKECGYTYSYSRKEECSETWINKERIIYRKDNDRAIEFLKELQHKSRDEIKQKKKLLEKRWDKIKDIKQD